MKKKLATLFIFVFVAVCVFSGCNLFDTNNYAALSSIVATSGDVKITREQLINAYNNGGYYYTQYYGYSQEDTMNLLINQLINQEYLSKYIDELEDNRFKLNALERSDVVAETWDYVNSSLSSIVKEVRRDFGLSTAELETKEESDPEFAPQKQYTTKFEFENNQVVYIEEVDTSTHKVNNNTLITDEKALEYAKTGYDYREQIQGTNADYKLLVWKKYISALKNSQKFYNYADMSDEAVFYREIERVFKTNLTSAKNTKFENEIKKSTGLQYIASFDGSRSGRYVVTDNTLSSIVTEYQNLYASNVARRIVAAQADVDGYPTKFYQDLTSTTERQNYVYYGEDSDETLITCTHILIKLGDEQTSQISALKSNKLYQGEQLEDALLEVKSAANTLCFERDLETGEVIDETGISVSTMFENLSRDLAGVSDVAQRVRIFDNYLYRYNVDSGIINSQFGYVVGTKTSAMVDSFTNAVQELYDNGNGQEGSIKMIFEENDNYSGYHIVMYTGTLKNNFNPQNLSKANVYQLLSQEKTSISYNQTMFEYMFDRVVTDNFSTYQSNLIASLKNGKDVVYQKANYSDLC